jgi:cytochrome b pre-mRNA-processing protein 3
MDGSIRELGIGDLVVGKQIGKMMGALGGRLAAFRAEIDAGGDFKSVVAKNIFHEAPPNDQALDYVSRRLRELHGRLQALPCQSILNGSFPA